jgi:hypothetical protein
MIVVVVVIVVVRRKTDPSLTLVELISPIIQETSAGDFLGEINMK